MAASGSQRGQQGRRDGNFRQSNTGPTPDFADHDNFVNPTQSLAPTPSNNSQAAPSDHRRHSGKGSGPRSQD